MRSSRHLQSGWGRQCSWQRTNTRNLHTLTEKNITTSKYTIRYINASKIFENWGGKALYQPRRHFSQMHTTNYRPFIRDKAAYWANRGRLPRSPLNLPLKTTTWLFLAHLVLEIDWLVWHIFELPLDVPTTYELHKRSFVSCCLLKRAQTIKRGLFGILHSTVFLSQPLCTAKEWQWQR